MGFVIFQPDRYLLKKKIHAYGHLITGRMLDIGAGEVDRYARFFKFTERVTTDIHQGTNVDVVASADKLPFEQASFDSVVCTQVLEHVPDPQIVVDEMYRVLKPGGAVLATIPQTTPLHEEPHDYYRYTRYGIQHLFERSGFTISHIEQEAGYYALIAQLRIRHLIDLFRLYERPLLGKIASQFFKFYSYLMIWFDERTNSETNSKHTLGYIVIAKK